MTEPGCEPTFSISTVQVIDVRLGSFEWSFPRREAERIEAHWAELRSAKPRLYDGEVLLARDLRVEADALRGSAFVSGYKSFVSWRDFGYPDASVFNLFAMPALRSADGAFMLGRMSAGTANAGRLYFPAGTPEPSDAGPDGRLDADANILRELEEETGLTPGDVCLGPTWTIVRGGSLVACLKVAQSSLSAGTLRQKVSTFIATQRHPELDDLYPVRGSADFDSLHMPPFMLHYLRGALGLA